MKKSQEQYKEIIVVKQPIRAWNMSKAREILLNPLEIIFVTNHTDTSVYIDYEKMPYVISKEDYDNNTKEYCF